MTRRITWLCTQGAVTTVLVALGVLAESGVINPQLKPNALTVLLGYGCANAALFIADGEGRGISRTTQATAVDAVVTHISHVPPGTEQATEAMKAGSQLLSIVVPAHPTSPVQSSSFALPAGTVTVEQPVVPSSAPVSSSQEQSSASVSDPSIVPDSLSAQPYDPTPLDSVSPASSRQIAVRPACRQRPASRDAVPQSAVSNGHGTASASEPSQTAALP